MHEKKRRRYLKTHYKLSQAGRPIVFIDETGFESSSQRLFARAFRGVKVFDVCRGARQKRTSLIGGYCDGKLIAPVLFSGTCNTKVFNAWFASQLLPVLEPGTVIVLDNATFHRASTTTQIVQNAQCELLFLPPYSPHLSFQKLSPLINFGLTSKKYGPVKITFLSINSYRIITAKKRLVIFELYYSS